MPCMTGLTRMPALKCCNCRLIYSAPWPARFGFTGTALFPSAPWQAAQIVSAVCFALARSGLTAFCAAADEAITSAVSDRAATSDVRSILSTPLGRRCDPCAPRPRMGRASMQDETGPP